MNPNAMQVANDLAPDDSEKAQRVEDQMGHIQEVGAATPGQDPGSNEREAFQHSETRQNETPRELLVASESGQQSGQLGTRLLRVTILALCYFVLEVVVKAVTIAQFVFTAWKKHPHPGLQRLGDMIAQYMFALWRYCTFASDDAPWPFKPWPRLEERR